MKFRKVFASFSLLVLIIIQFSACAPSSTIEGSADLSNEHEGGPSKTLDKDDVGFNVGLQFMWGINGHYSHTTNSSDERNAAGAGAVSDAVVDGLPFGYVPASASGGGWHIEAGPQLIRKGSKNEGSATHLTYLELLGDLIHEWPAGEGTVFAGGGPYIGYGISGNVKFGDTKVSAFGGEDGYKRFDAGVHLKAGYALPSSLRFSLGYELGLVNKSPAPDFTSRNRTISLNIGYSLNKILAGFKK